MSDLQMLGNGFFENLAWYRRTKDLVSLFYPKVHLFKNSVLKIVAQLPWCIATNGKKCVYFYKVLFKNFPILYAIQR